MHTPNSEPTYKSIEAAVVHLNTNAAAIYFNNRDRKLVRMILTVGNMEYQAMRDGGVVFATPNAPHIHSIHPVGATGTVIREADRYHRKKVSVFR